MSQTLDTKQLMSRIDARDLAREILGDGKRTGRAVMYRVRSERTASFAVYPDGYKDFGDAGDAGDTFGLLVRLGAAANRTDAIKQVADRLDGTGATLTASITRRADPAVASDPPPAAWQREMAAAVERHHAYLMSKAPDAQRARAWLHARGITDDLIVRFKLGYNPRWHKTGYVLPETDADGGKRRVSIPPGITIGWFADGALWSVHVRCREAKFAAALGIQPDRDISGDETAKYKYVTGSHIRGALFNGDALQQQDQPVLFVEGEFDAMIAAATLDGVNVVTLGSAATHLASRWRTRIAGQSFVCLDNDQAGRDGAATLLKCLPSNAQRIELPAEKDITDYAVSGGDLRAWFAVATAQQDRAGQQVGTDQSATKPIPAAQLFADGLPDSWREALLKIDGAAALTYEIITEGLRAGRIDPDHITVAAVLEMVIALGWGVNEATIRRGFKTLAGVFFADLPTEKESDSSVGKFENNSPSGRKSTIWRLITLSEARPRLLYAVAPRIVETAYPAEDTPEQTAVIAPLSARALADAGIADADAARELEQLDQQLPPDQRAEWTKKRVTRQYRQLADRLDDLRSTPLTLAGEDWKPRNASIYRESYLRALKVADPNAPRSNRQIADALGLKSPKTAAAVVRRAGLQVHGEQFETRQITRAANVEQQVNKIARFEVQGKPRFIEIQTADAVTEIPYSAAELTRQIERGASVSVKFQVANRHEVIADAKPIERPRRAQQRRIELPADDPGALETAASEPPRVHITTPRADDEPTLGYTPEWVRRQIALRLRRLKWMHDGMYMNPETGEIAPMHASAADLLGLMLGRNVKPADPVDALITFAIEEFGAIPRALFG